MFIKSFFNKVFFSKKHRVSCFGFSTYDLNHKYNAPRTINLVKGLFLFCLLYGAVQVQAAPEIQHWQTSKGVDVYFVEVKQLPMIDIKVIFDAGSSRDDNKAGLAALTNGLLNQGVDGMDADQISQAFESKGAILDLNVGFDSASISLRSLTEKDLLNEVLKSFANLIAKPSFPEKALERQRSRTLVGLRSKLQSPGALAKDAFMQAVYKAHPYSKPKAGYAKTVKSISQKDIISFYQKHYVAKNAIIAMVGAVDRKKAEQIAEQLTADIKLGEKPKSLNNVQDLNKPDSVFIEHPSTQTHIIVGQAGLKWGDEDYFPLYVGNHILGGGGMVSRLFEEIREKRGLSYSVYSYFSPMRYKGPFLAGLQTKTEQKQEALDTLMANINKFIKEGPSEAELIAAKKNITGGYPLRIDSNKEILNYVAAIAYYKLPLDYLKTFSDNVNNVTTKQIKDAFQRRLSPDKFITVTVGSSLPSK